MFPLYLYISCRRFIKKTYSVHCLFYEVLQQFITYVYESSDNPKSIQTHLVINSQIVKLDPTNHKSVKNYAHTYLWKCTVPCCLQTR